MGRLIEANSLRDRASEYALSSDEYERFCKIIEGEPTAYDVDAVVKELEEAKKKNFESYKEATDTLDIICYGNVVNAYGDAISVVKAGGIDG